MIMNKLLEVKFIIKEKIENCQNDLIGTKTKLNEIFGINKGVSYVDTDIMEQYNKLITKIERLKGELDAYIDILSIIKYMEVK